MQVTTRTSAKPSILHTTTNTSLMTSTSSTENLETSSNQENILGNQSEGNKTETQKRNSWEEIEKAEKEGFENCLKNLHSIQSLINEAKQGNLDALCQLGFSYQYGLMDGIIQKSKAVVCYQIAAENTGSAKYCATKYK